MYNKTMTNKIIKKRVPKDIPLGNIGVSHPSGQAQGELKVNL